MKKTEHQHQAALIKWANAMTGVHPELRWLHAIPNGGQRNVVTGVKLKAEGVRAGVSDLFLPTARHGYHGMYIEMKSENGRTRPSQLEFMRFVRGEGYKTVVCSDWTLARTEIEQYLK